MLEATMTGRMSISWLLNKEEEPQMTQIPPIAQIQDDRYAHLPTHTSEVTMLRHKRSSGLGRSGSSPRATWLRAPRPTYSQEEDHFIWYHRIDLEKDWEAVSQAFNEYFQGRYRDGKAGLQCRLYRILCSAGTPAIRTLKRSNNRGQFSLLARRRDRYPWMHSEHQEA